MIPPIDSPMSGHKSELWTTRYQLQINPELNKY